MISKLLNWVFERVANWMRRSRPNSPPCFVALDVPPHRGKVAANAICKRAKRRPDFGTVRVTGEVFEQIARYMGGRNTPVAKCTLLTCGRVIVRRV